jgi:hypothetical protein
MSFIFVENMRRIYLEEWNASTLLIRTAKAVSRANAQTFMGGNNRPPSVRTGRGPIVLTRFKAAASL